MSNKPDGLFRMLLRIFPREFRGDFGDQMAADFRDQHEAATERSKSVAALWVRTVADFFRRAPLEHLDILKRDTAYALRLLRRRPGFTASALLTLALGIGLNTAVYSVVSAVLWRELPLPASDRLVQISARPGDIETWVSPLRSHLSGWREQSRTLDLFSAVGVGSFTITVSGEPDSIFAMKVDRGFFDLTGAKLSVGRRFVTDDFVGPRSGARTVPRVVILGHRFWQQQFGGRTTVIGERLAINGGYSEIVAVLAPEQPYSRIRPWSDTDLVAPLLDADDSFSGQAFVGRLAPGATIEAAQSELTAIAVQNGTAFERSWRFRIGGLRDGIAERARSQLLFLLGAAGVVLLIACANVTTLLLSHAAGRGAELSMRATLGATPAHLIRQTITESLVLTLAGGGIGFVVSILAVPLLVAAVPPGEVPRLHEVTVDARVLSFSAAVTIGVGLLCGLGACRALERLTLLATHQTARATRRGRRFRQALAASAIGFALMLVLAASLMVRTIQALDAVDLGFDPSNVMSVSLDLPAGLQRPAEAALERDIVEEVRSLPGVVGVGIGSAPIGGSYGGVGIRLPAAVSLRNQQLTTNVFAGAMAVSAGYFEVLKAQLVEGRFLEDADATRSPGPAVVDVNAAEFFWPRRSPLGETFWRGNAEFQVVGVVKHMRRTMELPTEQWVFFHHMQSLGFWGNEILVKTDGDPLRVAAPVRERIARITGRSRERDVTTLEANIDVATAQRRFIRSLIGLFSLIALALALAGIYGIVAESVAQRVPEIGVRMALGATATKVMGLFLRQGAWIIAIGLAFGLAGALAFHRAMTTLVFGVETLDPPAFIAAVLCLFATGMLACAIPARRAAQLDPVAALRQE